MKSLTILAVAGFLLGVNYLWAQSPDSASLMFTGQINYAANQNHMQSEECLQFPAQPFTTQSGETILVVFLNQEPDTQNITVQGFFQEVNNVCTKGGTTSVFMVTQYDRKADEAVEIKSITKIGSNLTKKQAQEVLDLHNQSRQEVGVPPLNWSPELSQIAQQWADHLAQNGCEMEHSEGSETGENLYWTSRGSESTPSDAVRAWYSEKEDFKNVPLKGNDWYETGHYSQMVWKSTTHVGMASATCSKGQTIVVANYSPPGNYMGEKAY